MIDAPLIQPVPPANNFGPLIRAMDQRSGRPVDQARVMGAALGNWISSLPPNMRAQALGEMLSLMSDAMRTPAT